MRVEQLGAFGAEHQMVFGRQAADDGSRHVGIRRLGNGCVLSELLVYERPHARIGDQLVAETLRRDPRHTTRTIYQYGFAIDPDVFHNTHEVVCAALDAEGIPADTGYQPMNRYDLFQPGLSRLPVPSVYPERFDYTNIHMPEAERAAEFARETGAAYGGVLYVDSLDRVVDLVDRITR